MKKQLAALIVVTLVLAGNTLFAKSESGSRSHGIIEGGVGRNLVSVESTLDLILFAKSGGFERVIVAQGGSGTKGGFAAKGGISSGGG
ncbi:hypothetical protein P1X15_07360 [Runella sp. MFBS21]|uniref:hypothetical protein n=1 Tax=Runella sp. MFBS21 TaxID=3034018 RepID=UPI0023F80F91|nr:hypothetical protein [Runella sp. MFBS21]MDF7817405.1 hypothetical protein [Runella sp. MFBS21]